MPEGLRQIFETTWPILLMVVIFYFILYKPQRKEQKQREEMLNSLKKGQKIVTIGGIYGTINSLTEEYMMLQVAEKVEIKVSRSSVARVLTGQKDAK